MVHFTWGAQCFCILDEDVEGPRRQICGRRAIFDLQKSSFVDIIFRDRCRVSYASAALFRGRRSVL
jgi:hypothetical protein